jgi:hypothetical protein
VPNGGAKAFAPFGFRVAEPHHDGTPHWHLLLFLRPEEVEYATAIFRKHALKEDGYEPGAQEHRFTVTPIDEKFGSATGYIAKYISKNIDGYGMDGELDDESGQPVKEMAKRVRVGVALEYPPVSADRRRSSDHMARAAPVR